MTSLLEKIELPTARIVVIGYVGLPLIAQFAGRASAPPLGQRSEEGSLLNAGESYIADVSIGSAATSLYSRILESSTETAEMVKQNSFRTVNIGLVNEIAMMSLWWSGTKRGKLVGIDPITDFASFETVTIVTDHALLKRPRLCQATLVVDIRDALRDIPGDGRKVYGL